MMPRSAYTLCSEGRLHDDSLHALSTTLTHNLSTIFDYRHNKRRRHRQRTTRGGGETSGLLWEAGYYNAAGSQAITARRRLPQSHHTARDWTRPTTKRLTNNVTPLNSPEHLTESDRSIVVRTRQKRHQRQRRQQQ